MYSSFLKARGLNQSVFVIQEAGIQDWGQWIPGARRRVQKAIERGQNPKKGLRIKGGSLLRIACPCGGDRRFINYYRHRHHIAPATPVSSGRYEEIKAIDHLMTKRSLVEVRDWM